MRSLALASLASWPVALLDPSEPAGYEAELDRRTETVIRRA